MPRIFEDSSPANVTCSHCGILEYLQNLYIGRGGALLVGNALPLAGA